MVDQCGLPDTCPGNDVTGLEQIQGEARRERL
jgi:hypothetical protein